MCAWLEMSCNGHILQQYSTYHDGADGTECNDEPDVEVAQNYGESLVYHYHNCSAKQEIDGLSVANSTTYR